MTTISTTEYDERVAAGAAFLDEHWPGWDYQIDIEMFDLCDPCECVLGQVYGGFYEACHKLGLDDARPNNGQRADEAHALGFFENARDDETFVSVYDPGYRDALEKRESRWSELERAWVRLIEERRS